MKFLQTVFLPPSQRVRRGSRNRRSVQNLHDDSQKHRPHKNLRRLPADCGGRNLPHLQQISQVHSGLPEQGKGED